MAELEGPSSVGDDILAAEVEAGMVAAVVAVLAMEQIGCEKNHHTGSQTPAQA